jgi:hypothetical protein
MPGGADPPFLTSSLFVQQFLGLHAVVDRLPDRVHGYVLFPSNLVRC